MHAILISLFWRLIYQLRPHYSTDVCESTEVDRAGVFQTPLRVSVCVFKDQTSRRQRNDVDLVPSVAPTLHFWYRLFAASSASAAHDSNSSIIACIAIKK